MTTLIIGGAGFIGSHLADELLTAGHEVIILDNFSLGNKDNIKHLDGDSRVKVIEGDATDASLMDKVFTENKIEYVFHLAANSDIQASAKNPEVEYRNTYTTTFVTLNTMRNHGVKNMFFASTSAVYGDKRDVELNENTPNLAPISYYGAAKLGSEALISAFSYMNDMKVLVFRFPNVIGPRLTHGVIFDFIKKLDKDNSCLEILGDGRQTKPYIYVTDLAQAIVKFMDCTNSEEAVTLYNLGVEGDTSVTKIADIICEVMGLSNVKYNYTGGEGGWKGDVPRFKYCLDKIHSTGWKASCNSDEAVRKTVESVIGARG